jgi:hypothetical protein
MIGGHTRSTAQGSGPVRHHLDLARPDGNALYAIPLCPMRPHAMQPNRVQPYRVQPYPMQACLTQPYLVQPYLMQRPYLHAGVSHATVCR